MSSIVPRWALTLALLSGALGACELTEASAPDAASTDGIVSGAVGPQQGPTVTLEVADDAIYCAATTRCEPKHLVDPFTGRPGPTLSLAFTCRADPDGEPVPHDVFQTIHRRMRCFNGGDPGAPATWTPRRGHLVLPLKETAASGVTNALGDAQSTIATLLNDVRGFAFCEYEAWGLFYASQLDPPTRSAAHLPAGPIASWRVLIEERDGTVDCHLDDGLSGLTTGRTVSVTYDAPESLTKGIYPVVRSVLATLPAALEPDVAGPSRPVRGLRLAYAVDTPFPLPLGAAVADMASRDLWVADANTGLPLDVAASHTCASMTPEGQLASVAVLLTDWWDRAPVGAILIRNHHLDGRFQCDRSADPGGGCRLIPLSRLGAEAPCLAAVRF